MNVFWKRNSHTLRLLGPIHKAEIPERAVDLIQSVSALICILVLLSAGCKATGQRRSAGTESSAQDGKPLVSTNGNPSIYYIGEKAILTFETNRPLVIPINGADLYQNPVAWSVKVDGVVPAI